MSPSPNTHTSGFSWAALGGRGRRMVLLLESSARSQSLVEASGKFSTFAIRLGQGRNRSR